MADHRANVYRDETARHGERWVYRWSSAGGCLRALVAARMGMSDAGWPESFQGKLDESAGLEDVVLKWFCLGKNAGKKWGTWKLIDPADPGQRHDNHGQSFPWVVGEHDGQLLGEIPVGTEVVLRGHPDAVAQLITVGKDVRLPAGFELGQRVVVEAKAFGDSYWKLWQDRGMEAFPYYDVQLRLERVATGLPAAFVVGHKVDGEITEVDVAWFSGDVSIGDVKAKVLRAEKLAKVGDYASVPCNNTYPCGFYYLHDDKADAKKETVADLPVIEVDDDEWASIEDWMRATARVREADAARREADADRKKTAEVVKAVLVRAAGPDVDIEEAGWAGKIERDGVVWKVEHVVKPRKGYEVKPSMQRSVQVEVVE